MQILSNTTTKTNTVEVTFRMEPAEFEAAIEAAYQKKRKNITVPGFRKGKATRKMIENHFGESVFYEDAINGSYQKAIADVIEELKLDVVDTPDIQVKSVGKEEGVEFAVEFTTKPEVKVKKYKGLEVEKTVKTVSDDDVAAELEKFRKKAARIVEVTDRAVENGDSIVFDFAGYKDGVAFEGGTAKNYTLKIGSGQFIPGFEEQIVGKKLEEEFTVNVKFPEDYHSKDLAGADAEFVCTIHKIEVEELPEADDELAKDVSDFDTLDELKKDIKEKLEKRFADESENEFENNVTLALIDEMEAEIPQVMFENRIDDLVRDWDIRNRAAGLSLETYLKYTGATIEQFRENFREGAERQVKLRLALEEVAKLENIEASDEEVQEQYEKLAKENAMDVERVKMIVPSESIKSDLVAEKTFNFVKENAVVK